MNNEFIVVCEIDEKRKIIKCKIENILDLIFLFYTIEKNDLITTKTIRNIFIYKNGKRIKAGKKEGIVTLKVEKVTENLTQQRIKIKGLIVEGPEEFGHGYHSIVLEIGKHIEVKKTKINETIEKLRKNFSPDKFIRNSEEILKDFFTHLKKNDEKIAIGKEVKKFAESGAVSILLLSIKELEKKETLKLIEKVVEKRGKIALINEKMERGKEFCENIKLASFLRFRF